MSESQKQSVQKKGRKRFKDLFHRIRQQMEFYFSDANLHKDRFLKQKITESTDGYVDISLFLRFNKIRELVTETEPLIKALCQSQLLEVNEEKTAIRRVEPLTEATDVDERTVYVECLPAHVDHAWIKKIFSACGRVVYISLPKFHSTKDIKGFAFVEFENIAEAQTACQMMNNPPASVVEKRPGKFPRGSKDILRMSRQLQTGNVRKRRASESLLDNEQNNKTTKRRRTRSEGHDLVNSDECIKQAESLEPEQSPVTQSLQATTGSKMAASGGSGNMAATGGNIEGTVQLSKERKRKRAKVEFEAAEEVESVLKRVKEDADSVDVTADKTADESLASIDSSAADKTADESLASIDSSAAAVKRCKKVEMSVEEPDRKRKELEQGEENKNKKRKKRHGKDKNKTMFNIPELRVISKREWLELRSEYLQLQKANMSQLKQSLKALKQTTQQQQQQQQHVSKPVAAAAAECDLVTNSLEFTPNVIVHVTSQQPLCRKQLKTELSAAGTIAYFDVQDGAMEAYLRCADALSAAAIVRCDLPGYTMSLLSGDDEHDYWLKATNDRLKKLGTKSKQVKKHRGRDKVLKQAEKADMTQRKHITFDD